jgi:hypothetical protein
VPGTVDSDEPAIARPQIDAPLPVFIIGWGTVIIAVLLVVYGGFGINEYLVKARDAKAAIAALEEAASQGALVFQFLLFPVLSIIYALLMLVLAVQFMSLKKWSVAAMQGGGWTGVVLIALMKLNDMFFWCKRASATASFGYYATGLMGDILLMILMILPFAALAEFFKSEHYEKIENIFA